jgi:hypothetical protein
MRNQDAVWSGELRRWHRLDARGNKPGIAAAFDLACERLAYPVRPGLGEHDYPEIHAEPPKCVVTALRRSASITELNARLPKDLG